MQQYYLDIFVWERPEAGIIILWAQLLASLGQLPWPRAFNEVMNAQIDTFFSVENK